MPAPVVMAAVGAGAAAAHGAVLFVPPVAATVAYARFRSKQEAAVVPSSEGAQYDVHRLHDECELGTVLDASLRQ